MSKHKTIAIVSASSQQVFDDQIVQFVDDINSGPKNSYQCTLFYFRNLMYTFGERNDCVDIDSEKSLLSYDYVYIKTVMGFEEQAVALAHLLNEKGINFWPKELLSSLVHSKVGEYAILSVNSLPIPKTIHMPTNYFQTKYEMLSEQIGVPFVFKSATGTKARSNHLVHNKNEFLDYCVQYEREKFIAQELIDNSGDYRVLFVGGKPGLVFKRERTRSDIHLNNPSLGAKVQKYEFSDFPESVQQLCFMGVEKLGRDMAGIDLVFKNDSPDQPYFFEINASPQVISGSYKHEKIDQYRRFFSSL